MASAESFPAGENLGPFNFPYENFTRGLGQGDPDVALPPLLNLSLRAGRLKRERCFDHSRYARE